jgi:uncharacterized caspase-like protein/TPR repeat protein
MEVPLQGAQKASRGVAGRCGGARRAAFAALALAILWPASAAAETRVALVIGNASYKMTRLKNPRSDAGLMARTLSAVGFDVMTLMDATASDMRTAIVEFGRRLGAPDTVALFYYAGHGVQAGGDNYLIPLGQDITSNADVAAKAVGLRDVFKIMERSQARLNIVILDACRDNPFAASSGDMAPAGLAPVVAPGGTIIGYATAPGQVAFDGDGVNSPYTDALAASIPTAGATLEEVFRAARRRVLTITANKQTPWEHSSLISEFYFKPKMSDAEPNSRGASEPANDARLAEIADWDLIKSSHDPDVFKAHLSKYPDGLFAELANVKIGKLTAMHASTPWNWIMTGGGMGDAANTDAINAYEQGVKLDAAAATAEQRAAAVKLYAEAAGQGLAAAQYSLGRAYDHGRGVEKDSAEAVRWYARAADQNHPAAMAALATMYEFGEGAPLNLAEALRLYRLAADAGDASGLAGLGYLYAEGKGVKRDAIEARRLYQMAAEKGAPRAMFNLALMLLKAQGGTQDLAGAVKLLQSAADKGHAGGLQELAYLYDEGRGVARNPKLAAQYLLQAVKAAKPDGRSIVPMARGWSFATRREVQRQLAARGLYRGILHGFLNSATRQAMIASADQ